MHYSFAHAKYAAAVTILATDPGTLQERLIKAHPVIKMIDIPQVPPSSKDDIRWIQRKLNNETVIERSNPLSVIKYMDDSMACKLARRITRIFMSMCTVLED